MVKDSRNFSNESFDINPSNRHQILFHSKEELEAGMEKRREKGDYSLHRPLCQIYKEQEVLLLWSFPLLMQLPPPPPTTQYLFFLLKCQFWKGYNSLLSM